MSESENYSASAQAALKQPTSIIYRWLGDKIFTVIVVILGSAIILLALEHNKEVWI